MKNLSAVITYKEFYKKPAPQDPLVFLGDYPTDAILLVLCRVNATLFQNDGQTFECQSRIFLELFNQLINRQSQLVTWHYQFKMSDNNGAGPIFFSEQAVTWLIGFCFNHFKPMPDTYQINEEQIQKVVFDSILTANEIYFERRQSYDLSTYEGLWQVALMQQRYVRNMGPMMVDGTVKILLFRKFIITNLPEGEALIKEFKEVLGLRTVFDYAGVYLDTIQNSFVNYKNTGKVGWLLQISPSSKKLIDAFALYPKDVVANGFRGLYGSVIPKPIYFINGTYPVLIDYNFLGFLLNTAFPYNFYSYTSLKAQDRFKRFDDYKSFLGKDFYEAFATKALLKNSFPKHIFFTEEAIRGYSDFAVVKDEKEIFLFEVKSTSLHFKMLEEGNVEGFRTFVQENFLQEKGVKSKNKGVYQLVKAIQRLSTGDFFLAPQEMKSIKKWRIYPVIVYTDAVLDTPGVNRFCNDTFQQAIAGLGELFGHVYPITMINLDFFVRYYSHLKADSSLFTKLIRNYHSRVNSGFKSLKKSNNPYVFLNANISFTYYVFNTRGDLGISFREIAEDLDLLEDDSLQ